MIRHDPVSDTDPSKKCVICRENPGTVRIVEGMVCKDCMPYRTKWEFPEIRLRNIRAYCKNNPDWVSVSDSEMKDVTASPSKEPYDVLCRAAQGNMLFTGSGRPQLYEELNFQIRNSERIDIVVSFIMQTGLSLLMDALRDFTETGHLRVITTDYMRITEVDAVTSLADLPNTEVRMEISSSRDTRLHAKTFIFHRDDGDTAFVGSANISGPALTDGREWVVRITDTESPETVAQMNEGYEELWTSKYIRTVTRRDRAFLEKVLNRN